MEDNIITQKNLSTKSNILVCISGSPSNPKVIRIAARNATLTGCQLTALYVRTREGIVSTMLKENIELSESLGASFKEIYGEDVIMTIADYAKANHITDLYIGMSGQDRKQTVSKRLTKLLPDIDIHIIPDERSELQPSGLRNRRETERYIIKDTMKLIFIMTIATIVSLLFYHSSYSNANIITVYILAVLVASIMTSEKRFGVLAAVLYILLFNFLFIDPRFTLRVYDPSYMVTYFVSICAAVLTGTLSAQMKESMKNAKDSAYQARVLLNATKLLEKAETEDELFTITVNQLIQLLGRDIVLFSIEDNRLSSPIHHHVRGQSETESMSESDIEIANWVYKNRTRAGAFTGRFSDSCYQFLAMITGEEVYGVIAIDMNDREFTEVEQTILLSIIGECSIRMENRRIARERENAVILAESERFRANLLRSISHDLRTPLTSISGDAYTLMNSESELSHDERLQIYTDVYDDSMWLINMVENLLSISKLNEGVKLNKTAEVLEDVLEEALKHVDRHVSEHKIVKCFDHEFLMAEMDTRLIMQVVVNIVNNAIKYSSEHSTIRVSDERDGGDIVVRIEDDGPGISDEDLPHIFDSFYTGHHSVADAGRSLGLGLSLSKSIIEAHGGSITAYNVKPHGAGFSFRLKIKEIA